MFSGPAPSPRSPRPHHDRTGGATASKEAICGGRPGRRPWPGCGHSTSKASDVSCRHGHSEVGGSRAPSGRTRESGTFRERAACFRLRRRPAGPAVGSSLFGHVPANHDRSSTSGRAVGWLGTRQGGIPAPGRPTAGERTGTALAHPKARSWASSSSPRRSGATATARPTRRRRAGRRGHAAAGLRRAQLRRDRRRTSRSRRCTRPGSRRPRCRASPGRTRARS